MYVQSIPVNNSGLRLSLSINKVLFPSVAEAALMSEMAVLNTLRQTLKPISSVDKDIGSLYKKAENLYRRFLNNNPQGDVYFHKSPEGKKVIKLLQKFRSGYAGKLSSKALAAASLSANRKELDIKQLVEHAVKVMFVHNKHLDLAYGRLIQAMTCFLDMCALGCKSGNERYGMISGREKVFSGMMLKEIEDYSKEELAILAALRGLSNAGNSIDSGLDALISPLATAYSVHHAAGISNASTLNDQGPSKIIPTTNFLQGFHTNRAEDPELSLCADEAEEMQPQNKNSDVFGTLKRMAGKKIADNNRVVQEKPVLTLNIMKTENQNVEGATNPVVPSQPKSHGTITLKESKISANDPEGTKDERQIYQPIIPESKEKSSEKSMEQTIPPLRKPFEPPFRKPFEPTFSKKFEPPKFSNSSVILMSKNRQNGSAKKIDSVFNGTPVTFMPQSS